MEKLKEIRKELGELKYLVNKFLYQEGLPILTDLESFLDEIKQVCGYVDCMIDNQIDLPPESE